MENTKILETIKKLLALAGNNPNEEEANSAIAKARELMLRHNISESQLHRSDLSDYLNKDMQTSTITGSQYIRNILQQFFFVDIIIYAGGGGAWTMVGTKMNIEIAEYMFFHIRDKFNGAWRNYKHTTDNQIYLHSKRDYYFGLYNGLMQKLEDEKNRLKQEEGLVWIKDPNIQKFKEEKWGGKLTRSKNAMTPSSGDGYAKGAGHEAGRNMQLNQGLGSGATKQKMIGGK